MPQVMVILAFLCARLRDVATFRESQGPWWGPLVPSCAAIVAWLGFHTLMLRAGRVIDETGRLWPLSRAYVVMSVVRWVSLVALAVGVMFLGWDTFVRRALGDVLLLDELVIASPVLLVLALTWWSIEPLERRLREASVLRELLEDGPFHAPISRGQFLWQQMRHQMLVALVPVAMIIAWSEFVERAPWLMGARWWARLAPYEEALRWAGVLGVLMVTPAVLRAVWDTAPIAPGPLRDRILAVCARYGIRVRGPLVWRTHGTLVNAAILGMMRPFRYLLLTDAMLERMSWAHLEVVVAHEVAHVRLRHMLWMGVCVFGVVLSGAWGAELLMSLFDRAAWSHWIAAALSVLTLALGVLAFGFVSRRFEWEADAFAAAHVSMIHGERAPAGDALAAACIVTPEAARDCIDALGAVASLNGVDPARPSFRHGSIIARQRRLSSLVGQPVDRMPITRLARTIRLIGSLLLLLSLLPWLLGLV